MRPATVRSAGLLTPALGPANAAGQAKRRVVSQPGPRPIHRPRRGMSNCCRLAADCPTGRYEVRHSNTGRAARLPATRTPPGLPGRPVVVTGMRQAFPDRPRAVAGTHTPVRNRPEAGHRPVRNKPAVGRRRLAERHRQKRRLATRHGPRTGPQAATPQRRALPRPQGNGIWMSSSWDRPRVGSPRRSLRCNCTRFVSKRPGTGVEPGARAQVHLPDQVMQR